MDIKDELFPNWEWDEIITFFNESDYISASEIYFSVGDRVRGERVLEVRWHGDSRFFCKANGRVLNNANISTIIKNLRPFMGGDLPIFSICHRE